MSALNKNIASKTKGVVSFKLLVEGEDVTNKARIVSFSVYHAVNKISTATLVLVDGSSAKQEFELSNSEHYIPGKAISLQVGYQMMDEVIFEGVVVSQCVIANEKGSELRITCKAVTYAMTLSRKNAIFYEMKESEVIEKILSSYDIEGSSMDTGVVHNELVQYRATAWDYIQMLAEKNGLLFSTDGRKVSVSEPDFSKDPVNTISYGSNVVSVHLEMDSRSQFTEFTSKTWNFSDQEVEEVESDHQNENDLGNLSSKKLAKAGGEQKMALSHGGSLNSETLSTWINAKKQWQTMAKVVGSIRVQGYHLYKPMELVEVEGISKRFNGKHFVSEVSHILEDGNWTSDLKLGINSECFAAQYKNVNELPASGMIPAVSGLQVGVITALEGDPDGAYRVQVRVPMIDGESDGVWARVSHPYAGSELGVYFMPELGTEVLLGYLNDDPTQAIVLGGMHSAVHVPPHEHTDDNFIKTIKTSSEIKIEFDDEKKAIRLETPSGNKLELEEEKGLISMEDQNGNKITMDSDGVSIESAKDLMIKATGDVKLEGVNVEQKASASFKAEGSAGLEINSSANTVVKGSLVQIN